MKFTPKNNEDKIIPKAKDIATIVNSLGILDNFSLLINFSEFHTLLNKIKSTAIKNKARNAKPLDVENINPFNVYLLVNGSKNIRKDKTHAK